MLLHCYSLTIHILFSNRCLRIWKLKIKSYGKMVKLKQRKFPFRFWTFHPLLFLLCVIWNFYPFPTSILEKYLKITSRLVRKNLLNFENVCKNCNIYILKRNSQKSEKRTRAVWYVEAYRVWWKEEKIVNSINCHWIVKVQQYNGRKLLPQPWHFLPVKES